MAQIDLSSRSKPRPYRRRSGGFQTWHFYESTCVSTAIIRAGDVVQADVNVSTANHRIVKSSTMANVPNCLSTAFYGIAAEDSTAYGRNTSPTAAAPSGHKLPVTLADAQTEFLFATKAAGTAHLSSLVGTRRALGYDSTLEIHYCDVGNSTAGDAVLLITEVIDEGTTNGYVAAKFLSTNTHRFVSAAF